jgi:hypothetical protein
MASSDKNAFIERILEEDPNKNNCDMNTTISN